LICYAVCSFIAARRAVLHPDIWRYKILTGAFLCYALADLFWNLYFTIKWEYALFFSAADLSWIAVVVFLIAACLNIFNELTDEERLIVRRYRILSVLISFVLIASTHAVMVIIAGGLFNNICYGIVYFLLVYFSLQLWLAARKDIRPQMKNYHGAVMLFVLCDIIMFLMSCFWETANISMVFDMGLTIMPVILLYVMKKEVCA
jgi:hypothetical protein